MLNLQSVLGLFVLILCAWLLSADRRAVFTALNNGVLTLQSPKEAGTAAT
jgi:nucleoside permease NupC